jgi:hypothetical protein
MCKYAECLEPRTTYSPYYEFKTPFCKFERGIEIPHDEDSDATVPREDYILVRDGIQRVFQNAAECGLLPSRPFSMPSLGSTREANADNRLNVNNGLLTQFMTTLASAHSMPNMLNLDIRNENEEGNIQVSVPLFRWNASTTQSSRESQGVSFFENIRNALVNRFTH